MNDISKLRLIMIKQGLEAEMKGYRLTAKAPRCFKIIETEFGIKGKRTEKFQTYRKFCEQFGLEALAEEPKKIA